MDAASDSNMNKRKLEDGEEGDVSVMVEQQQDLVEAMAEGTNVEDEAAEQDAGRPIKRVKVAQEAAESNSEVSAVGPEDPIAEASAASDFSPPICPYLPPSSLVYSNPDGETGKMSPLKPHPIRWAIERRHQLERDSKAARGEEPTEEVMEDVGGVENNGIGEVVEWTYHLREKDVGINEYLSAGLGQMQGIIKQRFTDFMVYEIAPDGEVLHLKDIGPPKKDAAPVTTATTANESETQTNKKEAADKAVSAASEESANNNKVEDKPGNVEAEDNSANDDDDHESSLASLPESLRNLTSHRPHWNHPSTTAALVPILPAESIMKLHGLVVEGRKPPTKPKAEPKPAAAEVKSEDKMSVPVGGGDNGWAELAAKRAEAQARRAQEEEESMNAAAEEAVAVSSSSSSSRGGRGGRGQGRERGRGRGDQQQRGGGGGGRGGGAAGGRPEKQVDEREVLSELITDKNARTAFHATIRKTFNGAFDTFTKQLPGEEGSRVAIRWSNAGSQRFQSQIKGGKRAVDSDGALKPTAKLPPYIHFILQKANRDSQDCISHIARITRQPVKSFSMCGTKDKRGVTTQRICMRRAGMQLKDVWDAVNGVREGRTVKQAMTERGERGMRIGDLTYSNQFLELGMLRGNQFTITLRNVKAESREKVDAILGSLRERGFINYYGMQRFGTSAITSHAIGLLMLQGKYKEACETLLSRRAGEHPDSAAARQAWLDRDDPVTALRLMPRRNVAERCLWEFWSKPTSHRSDYIGALASIPRNLRLIYVHAYQSYVWNVIASERIKICATEPIVGDLVYDKEQSEDASGEEEDEDDKPQTSRRGAPSRSAPVKVLTEADLPAYKLSDVILPLPGWDITLPEGVLLDKLKAVMALDGLDPLKMRRDQKEYSLAGSYRKILHVPGSLTWKHLRYDDPDVSLAVSDEDQILGLAKAPSEEDAQRGEHWAVQISLTLGTSAYATMALREITKTETSAHHQTQLTAQSEDQAGRT